MSLVETEVSRLAKEARSGVAQRRSEVWWRLRRDPSAIAGAVLVSLFLVMALVGPLLAPHDPRVGSLKDVRPGFVPGPSIDHPLGLDHQGRDVLSRILHGARRSLFIGVGAAALATLLGIAIGTLAAVGRGWVDALVMRLIDIMLAIPGILFAIGLAALLGPSLLSITVAVGVGGVPIVARLFRGCMLAEAGREYIEAARALGATRRRLVLVHLLPNAVTPVLVGATLALGAAILEAAGLAFLGLGGADLGAPEWGRMVAEGQRALQSSPQLVFFPAAAIVLAVLGFNLLGDALRDAFDSVTAVHRSGRPGRVWGTRRGAG